MGVAAISKWITNIAEGAGKNLGSVVGKVEKGTAEATGKTASSYLKDAAAFAKEHPKAAKGIAIGGGIGAYAIGTGRGDALVNVAGAAKNTVDAGLDVASGTVSAAGTGVSALGSFVKDNANWLLPVGIGAGALLFGGNGIGKLALAGGAALIGFNALKGMNQPANEAVAQSSTSEQKSSMFDSLFGASKEMSGEAQSAQPAVQREKVDTSQLQYSTSQDTFQFS